MVGRADYPTEPIAETSRQFRQLGIGYANLGAMLMALGLPYDSDEGRAWAAGITALMTGHAYATSAHTAARMGPFGGYAENSEHMLRVLDMHREQAAPIDEELVPSELLGAAQQAWDEACELGRRLRRAQLAGVGAGAHRHHRPDDGLRHHRHRARPRPLQDEEAGRRRHHDHRQPDGAPGPAPPRLHRGADRRDRRLHRHQQVDPRRSAPGRRPRGGVRLLDGRQHHPPHRSRQDDGRGAAVHLRCHLQDGEHARGGHASRRSSSSTSTPGSSASRPSPSTATTARWPSPSPWPRRHGPSRRRMPPRPGRGEVVERIVEKIIYQPVRQKLRARASRTFEFRVADCKGFVTVGEFEDGRPGEIFVRVSKQGSTLAGIMDAFAISVSYGLQYGVPLRGFVETFTNIRFEPAGMTDDPDIRIANSIIDYIFRSWRSMYLSSRSAPSSTSSPPASACSRRCPAWRRRSSRHRQGDMPSDPPSVESAVAAGAQLGSSAGRRHHPRRRRPRPRSATATPRSACSAASRCSGPAPATPAPAAAPPAAAADRPEAPELVTIRRPLGPRIVTRSVRIRTQGGSAPTSQ